MCTLTCTKQSFDLEETTVTIFSSTCVIFIAKVKNAFWDTQQSVWHLANLRVMTVELLFFFPKIMRSFLLSSQSILAWDPLRGHVQVCPWFLMGLWSKFFHIKSSRHTVSILPGYWEFSRLEARTDLPSCTWKKINLDKGSCRKKTSRQAALVSYTKDTYSLSFHQIWSFKFKTSLFFTN